MILYHYTTKKSYDSIIAGNKLNPTEPFLTQDAAYGYGWYLTDQTPSNCDAWTVAHCWQTVVSSIFDKVEYYLKFDVPDWKVRKGREHVFLVALSDWDGILSSTGMIKYLEGSKTPHCPNKPCWLCEKISKIKEVFGWK